MNKDYKVDITILVNWKTPVSATKGQIRMTDAITPTATMPGMAGGAFTIGGTRKPPNPMELAGATAPKAQGKDNQGQDVKAYVSAKVQAMKSGDFPPQFSGTDATKYTADPWKKIASQSLRLTFTWPADAIAQDSVRLNNPAFVTIPK